MDFKKTDEQELLLDSIDTFFAQNPQFDENYLRECEAKQVPPTEMKLALVECGLGMLCIPEEYGGMQVDCQTMIMIAERFGFHGHYAGLGSMLQVDDILQFGTEDQVKAIIGELEAGKAMGFCLGLSEPQAGSDSSNVSTTATRRDGKVYINGHKTFITDADRAKYMLCLTRDFSDPTKSPYKSMSMWLVPLDAPGVKVENWHKIGYKLRSLCEVYLEEVEIDEKDLIGKEGNGFFQLMKNFEVERLVLAAESLGNAICCYNDAMAFAKERVQFGKAVVEFQLIQEKFTEMRVKIENMRNMLYKAAWEKDNGLPITISANLCKYYCGQAGFEVADDAMQILGGLGYTDESRVSRLWRDNRLNRIGGGTDQIMIKNLSKSLPKEGPIK